MSEILIGKKTPSQSVFIISWYYFCSEWSNCWFFLGEKKQSHKRPLISIWALCYLSFMLFELSVCFYFVLFQGSLVLEAVLLLAYFCTIVHFLLYICFTYIQTNTNPHIHSACRPSLKRKYMIFILTLLAK